MEWFFSKWHQTLTERYVLGRVVQHYNISFHCLMTVHKSNSFQLQWVANQISAYHKKEQVHGAISSNFLHFGMAFSSVINTFASVQFDFFKAKSWSTTYTYIYYLHLLEAHCHRQKTSFA